MRNFFRAHFTCCLFFKQVYVVFGVLLLLLLLNVSLGVAPEVHLGVGVHELGHDIRCSFLEFV